MIDKTNIYLRFNEIISDKPEKPFVVVYGLVNAGKSFLLNMLTNHIDDEYFKTNDIRETLENKQFESDRCIYSDTPGLDVNEHDDRHAHYGAQQADAVLFVHQPQGELDAKEISCLQNLKESFGDSAAKNILVVLSKIDKETPEKITLIEQCIRQQCEEKIGFSPSIFPVSNKRYQKGIHERQDALVNASCMDILISNINSLAANVTEVRNQRMLIKIDDLLRDMKQEEKILLAHRTRLRKEIADAFSTFNEKMMQFRDFIDTSRSNFKGI